MMFTEEQNRMLSAPLSPGHIKHRTQGGMQLSFLEGWHCIAEANRIFGFDGWDRETVDVHVVNVPREEAGRWRVAYMARVRIRVRPDILREGCGFGSGIDRDLGRAHESALKEAETDAMKRALMTFGNQFGLALYDKEQRGVGVEEAEPEPDLGHITVNGQRMSAYAARKDGRWNTLVASLRACPTMDALNNWAEIHRPDFEELPAGWVEELKTEWKDRAGEIKVRG